MANVFPEVECEAAGIFMTNRHVFFRIQQFNACRRLTSQLFSFKVLIWQKHRTVQAVLCTVPLRGWTTLVSPMLNKLTYQRRVKKVNNEIDIKKFIRYDWYLNLHCSAIGQPRYWNWGWDQWLLHRFATSKLFLATTAILVPISLEQWSAIFFIYARLTANNPPKFNVKLLTYCSMRNI